MNVQHNTPVAKPVDIVGPAYSDDPEVGFTATVQDADYLDGVAFDDTVVWDEPESVTDAAPEEATKH